VICTLTSYVCDGYNCICFCYGIPLKRMGANNRFREGSRCVIKIYAVSMRPRNLILRCHWNRGIRSRGLIATVGLDPLVSMTPLDPLQWHLQFKSSESFIQIFRFDPAVSLRPWDPIPQSHWHRGIRTFKMIISHISANSNQGPGGRLFDEKNRGPKIFWHCPFKRTFNQNNKQNFYESISSLRCNKL
jgi:hypothetical protein